MRGDDEGYLFVCFFFFFCLWWLPLVKMWARFFFVFFGRVYV